MMEYDTYSGCDVNDRVDRLFKGATAMGRERRKRMLQVFRSAALSTNSCGCWSWQGFLSLNLWSPWRARTWEDGRCGGRSSSGEGTSEGRLRTGQATGLCIEFPEPVQGPVAVGYASHFGMGGFVGVDNE